jgi:hypothetical protein
MFIRTRAGRAKRFASVILASVLLAGLLAGIFPVETLATGQICNLACCAGRAPHAAGSCMNGSCYAALTKRSSQHLSSSRRQVAEKLCGINRSARRLSPSKRTMTVERSSKKSEPQRSRISSGTITKPCLAECGSCGSGPAAGFRGHAVMARRQQSRPLAAAGFADASFTGLLILTTLVCQSGPRAPPIAFS